MILFGALLAALVSAPSPEWLVRLERTQYVDSSGDRIALSRAMGNFSVALPRTQPATAAYDSASGLLAVCLDGSEGDCRDQVAVRAADVGVPKEASRGRVDDPSIGMTSQQLLASFRTNRNFARMTLAKGSSGAIVAVWALFEYPGPRDYDHGYQSYDYRLYLLSDGVVVASGRQHSEN